MRFVLLGEATHGTHEFYEARAAITRRLIAEHGFDALAVEADWPDAYRVNRYVRGLGADTSAKEALGDFERFPLWMWRNTEVVRLLEWLHGHNAAQPENRRAGFYGLDLYSLHSSMHAVVDYLTGIDPEQAAAARQRYSCFDHFGEEPQAYGYATSFQLSPTCEDEVVAQLRDLRRRAMEYLSRDGIIAEDEYFCAEQNARLARNGEHYYRSMYKGAVQSWNLRDQHMAETLHELAEHLSRQRGRPARIVVWEHNSHIGDARATDMGAARGEWNVGQLVREARGVEAALVGFTTNTGSVSAASDWGGPVYRKRIRPGREDSYEGLFHAADIPAFELLLHDAGPVREALAEPMLERAIGVIYRPETERQSHYFHAQVSRQFDAVVHFDEQHALEPLEPTVEWHKVQDLPETFPFGV
ncbi:MAG: erythromycin esterase family protein [Candidatus Hydrogenedentales bacterium]